MLFEEEKKVYTKPERPVLPASYQLNYHIGFLFNFVSAKSTRFDLEPVLIYQVNTTTEYKRISLQVEKGLAFLHMLDDTFYDNLLEFSDNHLLRWMTLTGNRFIRNHSGSWAHVSARELTNLRKHYIEILQKLWPALASWPHVFSLKAGRFSNTSQIPVKLSLNSPQFKFVVDQKGDLITIRLILLLDGNECDVNLRGGCLLENNQTLYLPSNASELAILDLFKNGPLSFPLTVKKEIIRKYILPWMEQYDVKISSKLNILLSDPQAHPRVRLSELNESNLMIRPEFSYENIEIEYNDERWHVEEDKSTIHVLRRNKEEEKKTGKPTYPKPVPAEKGDPEKPETDAILNKRDSL